jgi:O-antigen/teichoic acid export membrane protein
MLQTWFTLLDLGISPALSREMARYVGGEHNPQSIRNLLRSIEISGFILACLIVLGLWGASSWLATDWLHPQKLSVNTIVHAFTIMGCVSGLRFIENIYRSGLVGLQRQVLLNVLMMLIATFRGLGAVFVLAFFSNSIQAFFIWQGMVSMVAVALFASFLHKSIPESDIKPRFSWTALRNVWRFAGGMLIIMVLATLLTQTDKILLSRFLSLEAFGYYMLASTVAGGLYMLPGPITQALYPKFTEFVTRGDNVSLVQIFHKGAQLISVFMGSVAMLLIFFGDVLLQLWTGSDKLVLNVAPVLSVLALGILLNGSMWLPGQMQYAHGRTKLGIYINGVAVVLLIPLLLWLVPRYGAIGAAWGWVLLNAGYVLVGTHFLFKRILPQEKWRWYWDDLFLPIMAAASTAFAVKWLCPSPVGIVEQVSLLLAAGVLIFFSSILTASHVKHQFSVSIKKAMHAIKT